MASEVNHHVGYSQANECWFVRFYPYQTEQQASEAAAAFTRPAPAATDTGLETLSVELTPSGHPYMKSDPDGDYVTRSQAEDIIRDLETKILEAAISDRLDDAGSPLTWQERAEKAEADNAAKDAEIAKLIHDLNRIKDHETELVNDNAAKDARVTELEDMLLKRQKRYERRVVALEAKLAAAVETHKSLFGDKIMEDILWPDVKPTDLITIRVQKQIYDKARAVLGGKPS